MTGDLPAFVAARIETLEKHGPAALVEGSRSRALYLKDLTSLKNQYGLGQTRSNALLIQYASKDNQMIGRIVEGFTQYMQWEMKSFTAMLPKGLGGNSAYTRLQKFGYIGSTLMLGGYQTLPFSNYMSANLYYTMKNNGLYDGTLEDFEKANMKESATEAGLILATSVLLLLLKTGLDDDDKEEAYYKISQKLSSRFLSELTFFIPGNFKAQYQILLSPAASTGTVEEFGRVVGSLYNEGFGTPEEQKRAKPGKKST